MSVLQDPTYFGIIAEYFHSIEYVKILSLISRFHYKFPLDKQYNFQIITRMLSREFFDIKSMIKLIGITTDNVYESIYYLHHFYMNFKCEQDQDGNGDGDEQRMTYWMRRHFLSRWRYLTSNNNVKLYGIKYWLSKMSASHENSNILKSFNCETNNDLVTTMILHSSMNGHRNSLNIALCTELMDFSIKCNGDLPKITELTRILVSTLDLNQTFKNINHEMFAWSLNYLCIYFEERLTTNNDDNDNISNDNNNDNDESDNAQALIMNIMNIEIVQELTALIAELILSLHSANIEHNIFKQNNYPNDSKQIDLFHIALNKYFIPQRLKKIWAKVMGGNMMTFTAGFTLTVSAFFNALMHLCDE